MTKPIEKHMSVPEAISRFVNDGDHLIIGNYTVSTCMELVFEIIRQGKRGFTVYSQSGILDVELLVAAGAVERLRSHPWVAEAEVRAVWPRTVEVVVVEHIPIARVASGSSWVISASHGVVVAGPEPIVEPVIELDTGRLSPGMEIDDEAVLGALEFVAALPVELKPELVVAREGADLVATVAGFRVELGLPKDMAQQAVTVAVLFDQGVEPGAEINLLSPLRPAVSNPQPLVESSQEVTTETTGSS